MNPVTGISLGRIGIGVVAFARPDLGARLLQVDIAADRQLSYTIRLFGSREVALGLATLLSRGAAQRNLVLAGIVVDGADAATGYLGMKEGSVSQRAAFGMIGAGLGAVASGVAGLVRRR